MRENDPLSAHFRLTAQQQKALQKLGILTVRDLLYHFPARYEKSGEEASTATLSPGAEVTIVGTLEKLATKKSWKRRIPVSEGYVRDASGRVKCMWFHQPYIAKLYAEGTLVKATGRVSGSAGKLYLANPELARLSATEAGIFAAPQSANKAEAFFAVYPESRGVTSLWFRHAIAKVLGAGVATEDPIPPELLERYHLPSLRSALHWIHLPKKLRDAEAAKKRFAFEEVFFIQLERQAERLAQAKERSFVIAVSKGDLDAFVASFPFTATRAQHKAIASILKDLRAGTPMSRLLEGDVGSGKTAVAAAAAFAVVRTRPEGQDFGTLQVAYMAPTEILAKQHFDSFIRYFKEFPVNIGLITRSGCAKFPSKLSREKATPISRAQLLRWVGNGEIPIVIGTHALIEKSVAFKHLALVVIDEQHRFGTNQRRKLARKELRLPHLLSMTATPIPRTLALTLYGDLDLTLLDEMPAGRKPVLTQIITPGKREEAYGRMREELKKGRQAYVVCPRIEEPDPDKAFALMAKSVKEEAKRLKKEVFPEWEIAALHSKMRSSEKDAIMQKFAQHDIDILVATSVVEVGVNVENATLILIEGAERFGLAQLHQLRGRVVRSAHQAYCFVCTESTSESALARLKALTSAKNGFELAERDLAQRGPGQLSGLRQWGISDVGMEALKNLKLVEAARAEALALIGKDPDFSGHPLLKQVLVRQKTLHFE